MTKVLPFYTVQRQFEKYADWILATVKDIEIDPYVLAALCWQESCFDPNAERFEPGFKKRYIDPLTDDQIRRRCPGVINLETERRDLATSWGIVQVMGQTARERGFFEHDLTRLKSHLGLLYGAKEFTRQLKVYSGDVDCLRRAISAYNAGISTERNRLDYVDPVLRRIEILRNEPLVQAWFEKGNYHESPTS